MNILSVVAVRRENQTASGLEEQRRLPAISRPAAIDAELTDSHRLCNKAVLLCIL